MRIFGLSLLTAAIVAGAIFMSNFPANAEVTDAQFSSMMKKFLATEEGRKVLGEATQSYLMDMQKKKRQEQIKAQEAAMEEQFKNPVKIAVGNSPLRDQKTPRLP